MPIRRIDSEAEYSHHRRLSPRYIMPNTYRTVPISHTGATKKYSNGTKAIVGRSKKTGKWVIQSVLIPKR